MKLGIIGGMGPLASAIFYKKLIDNIPEMEVVLYSHAEIADRTRFINKESEANPLPDLIQSALFLEHLNVNKIVMTCNTAHYFYEDVQREVSTDLFHLIEATAQHLANLNVRRVGLLATRGTLQTKIYQTHLNHYGIECTQPSESDINKVMEIIYKQVKASRPVEIEAFHDICQRLFTQGCERIIMGCTELSVIKDNFDLGDQFVDPLEVAINRLR